MAHEVRLASEAIADLQKVRAFEQAMIVGNIERMLTRNPELESQSRIKKLRQPAPAGFRLRVGEFRVFYDVSGGIVTVLRILHKGNTRAYLESST